MRHVVVGAFSWPPCFALIPRALIGFIRAVALGDITLTVPSLPVIGTDANVMPERECKMQLCLKRTAMVNGRMYSSWSKPMVFTSQPFIFGRCRIRLLLPTENTVEPMGRPAPSLVIVTHQRRWCGLSCSSASRCYSLSLDFAQTDIGTAWSRRAKESSSYVNAPKFHPIHRRTYYYAVIICEFASGTTVASDSSVFRGQISAKLRRQGACQSTNTPIIAAQTNSRPKGRARKHSRAHSCPCLVRR